MPKIAVGLLCLSLLAGCGKDEPSSGGGSGSGQSAATSKYGTPEDTAKTFFAACGAADWAGAAACCSKTAPGIDEIRDQKLADGEKETFKTLLGPAKPGTVEKAADGKTATVKFVVTKEGKTEDAVLKMELDGSDWKITDLD